MSAPFTLAMSIRQIVGRSLSKRDIMELAKHIAHRPAVVRRMLDVCDSEATTVILRRGS